MILVWVFQLDVIELVVLAYMAWFYLAGKREG